MKNTHSRNRIQLTDSQIARLNAATEALDEILIAYEVANGEHGSIELSLKAERRVDLSGKEYPWPRSTMTWWHAGDYFNGQGTGRTLEIALANHFSANDATKKRESAKMCRIQADILEREAAEIEAADQKATA